MSSTKSITARLCNVDVVIVGAGIAGSALALGLARRGFSVLLLEKTREHHDRVRGESMVPWGVAEADKLGVLDVLVAAGGHYTPLGLPYGEGVAPEAARARAIDVSKALPNVQGSMTFSHPKVCQALNDAAQAAGAVVLREVKQVVVTPGTAPRVTFALDTRYCEVSSRVIVGADGRGSIVARQIGAQVQTAPDHHFMAGLVVEDCTAWPEQEFAVGTDGDVTFYVFPQGNGRIRLYLCYGLNQAHRFAGPGNVRRFLGALRLSSLPHSNALSSATAAGPCRGYPNANSWIDIPVAPGVVLIGDAAGHNDPTIGQGLSSAFRDAQLVHEVLVENTEWNLEAFKLYVEERRERMRRLRLTGQQYSILRCEYTPEAHSRRQRALQRIAADPNVALPLFAVFKGPFGLPDDAYQQPVWDRILN